MRTNKSFVLQSNEEHHLGMSPLLKITGLGLVSCIPLDYMHLCLLGIMKKIIRCMVRGTYVPNSYGSVRLSKDQIVLINQRMIVISKWICSDFARVPHDLNEFKTFKSTELRQIMIHTGPYLFKNIICLQKFYDFQYFYVNINM